MMPETAEPTLAWSARTLCCSWISAKTSAWRVSEKRRMFPEALSLKSVTRMGKQIRMASWRKTWPRSRKKIRQRRESRVANWLKKPGRRRASGAVSLGGGGLLAVRGRLLRWRWRAGGSGAGRAGRRWRCRRSRLRSEHFLIGLAVFLPGGVPALGRLGGEPRIDLLGVVDGKIVGQLLGRPVEGDAALVQHEDGIVEFQMRQRVGHREHDAAVLARQVVQQADDFALRARIEAGGDFVAKQDFRIGNQLHRQPEPAFLAAGEHLHLAVADRAEAGFLEHAVDAVVEFRGVAGADAQAGGGLHGFVDGERIVGDGELRHVADFGWARNRRLRRDCAHPRTARRRTPD